MDAVERERPDNEPAQVVKVARHGSIKAPAEPVWSTVANFGSAHTYFPAVVDCRVEGSGVGARRHLKTDIGGTTVSELIELDHQRMAMSYRVIESTLPFQDYRSRIIVKPTEGGCDVLYASRFLPKGDADPREIRDFISAQLDSAIEGLRLLHETHRD